MKKIITTLLLSMALCVPSFADDVEVIELESVSEPVAGNMKEAAAPTSAEMSKKRLEAERLVQEAYYVVREFEHHKDLSQEIKDKLGAARAILVFPDVLKAGWVFGISGGQGVLLARSKTGEWSYPTFYTLTEGSAGLQFGVNSSRVLTLIMTGKGLGSIIDDNFKAGASLNAAVASEGGAVGFGTTTNLRQDLYTYANSKGAFIGASVDASSVKSDDIMNQAYYGTSDATTQSVILDGGHSNKSADAFRSYLNTFKYTYN